MALKLTKMYQNGPTKQNLDVNTEKVRRIEVNGKKVTKQSLEKCLKGSHLFEFSHYSILWMRETFLLFDGSLIFLSSNIRQSLINAF